MQTFSAKKGELSLQSLLLYWDKNIPQFFFLVSRQNCFSVHCLTFLKREIGRAGFAELYPIGCCLLFRLQNSKLLTFGVILWQQRWNISTGTSLESSDLGVWCNYSLQSTECIFHPSFPFAWPGLSRRLLHALGQHQLFEILNFQRIIPWCGIDRKKKTRWKFLYWFV